MASNIAEDRQAQVQLKKGLSSFAEAVILEVLKACVYLAMAYLLVDRACFFALCIVKGLLQSS